MCVYVSVATESLQQAILFIYKYYSSKKKTKKNWEQG